MLLPHPPPFLHFPAPGRNFPALCLQCSHFLGKEKNALRLPQCQSTGGEGQRLPGDMVLVPSAPGCGSKATVAARKRQLMLMLSVITHSGDAQICPGDTQPWTCSLHSVVGDRGLRSSWSLLHFLYLMLQSGALNKGTPFRASISQPGLSPLNPLWGPQGQMGSRDKTRSTSWVQDQPQEGVTPLPISSVARSSKRSLSCVPHTSHCWYLC